MTNDFEYQETADKIVRIYRIVELLKGRTMQKLIQKGGGASLLFLGKEYYYE